MATEMKITSVKFYGSTRGNFIRYAVIVLDDAVVIRGIKLIRRADQSIMIAMPSHKNIYETHEDIVFPINPEARQIIEQAILSAWARFPRVVVEK